MTDPHIEVCIEGPDERFHYDEPRMIVYGQLGPHVIAVVYCWREDRRRIISARKATRNERKHFDAYIKKAAC